MKKLLLYTVLIGSTLLGQSCKDSFVDRTPVYSLNSENYFNSKQDYEKALVAAYQMLHATYINVMLGEIASDNTLSGGESATDVIGIQQIDEMTHTPSNSNLRDVWNWMFAGVNRANFILEFKDKTNFDGKNQIIAEARFLRAYFHFELVKFFGGIPMNGDKRFQLNEEKSIPRASVEEVYQSIENDLIYASANLSRTPAQKGRVTKGAAQALLGKVYVFENKFPQAVKYLDSVIQSNQYSLVANYNTIFESNGENGPESVFEIQYTDAQGADFGCLQCSSGNVAVGFNGIRNYSGPDFDSGFSFNVPTKEAFESYEVGDRRRDVAILDIVSWAAQTNASYGKGYKHTGYFNRKYIPRKGDLNLGDQNLTNPNNYRAIRYADVLLLAAEAYSRGSLGDAKAQGYLNLVRDRAFGDTNHRISASGAALTELILKDRRAELMGEGHRFFDLVRTGKAKAAINGFVEGKNNVFPIPIEEIQFSNGKWQQNPNY